MLLGENGVHPEACRQSAPPPPAHTQKKKSALQRNFVRTRTLTVNLNPQRQKEALGAPRQKRPPQPLEREQRPRVQQMRESSCPPFRPSQLMSDRITNNDSTDVLSVRRQRLGVSKDRRRKKDKDTWLFSHQSSTAAVSSPLPELKLHTSSNGMKKNLAVIRKSKLGPHGVKAFEESTISYV